MYTEALDTSRNSLGALQKQQDIYSDSMEAHLRSLETAKEGVMDSLFDTEGFKKLVDFGTDFLTLVEKIIDGLGGIGPILTMISGTATRMFSGQIASGIERMIYNRNLSKNQEAERQSIANDANLLANAASGVGYKDAANLNRAKENLYGIGTKYLNQEELQAFDNKIEELNIAYQKKADIEDKIAKNKQRQVEIETEQQKITTTINDLISNEDRQIKNIVDEYDNKLKETLKQIEEEEKNRVNNLEEQKRKLEEQTAELERQKGIKKDLEEERTVKIGDIAKSYQIINKAGNEEIAGTGANVSTLNNLIGKYVTSVAAGDKYVDFNNNNLTNYKNQNLVKDNNLLDLRNKILNSLSIEKDTSYKNYIDEWNTKVNTIHSSDIYSKGVKDNLATITKNSSRKDISEFFNELIDKETLNKVSKNINTVNNTIDKAIGEIGNKDTITAIKAAGQSIKDEIKAQIDDITQSITKQQGEVNKTQEEINKTPTEEQNKEAIEEKKQRAIAENEAKKEADAKRVNAETNKGIEKEIKNSKELTEEHKNLGTTIEDNEKKLEENNKVIEKGKSVAKEFGQRLQLGQQIQAITRGIGGVAQMASSLTSLGNLKNIITSEDLNDAEKFQQTIATLGFSLPSLISGFKSASAAIQAMGVAAKTSNIVLFALTAVVTAVMNGYQALEDAREERIKNAKKEIEDSDKQIAQYREASKNIQQLITNYKGLAKQYDSNELSLEDLRLKTYELCNQYGEQDLAIQALSASYKELNRLMIEAQNIKLEDNLKEETKYREKLARETQNLVNEYKGTTYKILANAVGTENEVDIEAVKDKYSKFFDSGLLEEVDNGAGFKIDLSNQNLANAYLENSEEFIEALKQIYDADTAKKVKDWIEEAIGDENIEKYKQSKNDSLDTITSIMSNKFEGKDIHEDYSEFDTELQKISKEYADKYNLNQDDLINSFKKSYFSKIENVTLALKDSLINDIEGITLDKVESLSEEDLRLLTKDENKKIIISWVNQDGENFDIDTAIEKLKELTESTTVANKAANISSLISVKKEKDEKLTSDEIDSLFKDEVEILNTSKEKLQEMSKKEQLEWLNDYYKSLIDDLSQHNNEVIDSYDRQIQDFEDRLEQLNEFERPHSIISGKMSNINLSHYQYSDEQLKNMGVNKNKEGQKEEYQEWQEHNKILQDRAKVLKILNKDENNLNSVELKVLDTIKKAVSGNIEQYKAYLETEEALQGVIDAKLTYENSFNEANQQKEINYIKATIDGYGELRKAYFNGQITSNGYNETKEEYKQQAMDKYSIDDDTLSSYAELNNLTREAALGYLIAEEALNSLSGSFEKDISILKDEVDTAKKGSLEYSKTLTKVQNALRDAFGVNWDAKEIIDNAETIKLALEGDQQAWQNLINTAFNTSIDTSGLTTGLEEYQRTINNITGATNDLKAAIEGVNGSVLTFDGKLSEDFVKNLKLVLMAQEIAQGLDGAEAAQNAEDKTKALLEQFGFKSIGSTKKVAKGASTNPASDSQKSFYTSYDYDYDTEIKSPVSSLGNSNQDKTREAGVYHAKAYEKDIYVDINKQLEDNKKLQEDIKYELQDQNLTLDERIEKQNRLIEAQEREQQLLKNKEELYKGQQNDAAKILEANGVNVNREEGTSDFEDIYEKRYNNIENRKATAEGITNQEEYKKIKAAIKEDEYALEQFKKANDDFIKASEGLKSVTKEYEAIGRAIDATKENNKELIKQATNNSFDHEIKLANKELKELQREMTRLNKLDKKYDIFDARIENLNKQKEAYQKMAEIEGRRAEFQKGLITLQQNQLNSQLSKLGLVELEIGADGQLLNAEGVLASIDAFRNEKNKEIVDELIKQIKEVQNLAAEWSKALDQQEQYNQSVLDIDVSIDDEKLKKVEEELNERLKYFKRDIKLTLDYASAKRDFNQFLSDVKRNFKDGSILENMWDTIFNINSFEKEVIPTLTEGVKRVQGEINTIRAGGESDLYGIDIEAAIDDLNDYRDQLQDALVSIGDLIKSIRQSYLDMIDKVNDRIQDQLNLYKQMDGLLEHDKTLTNLIYGDKAYDKLDFYFNKQAQNNLEQAAFLKEQVAFWEQEMESVEVGSEEWEKFRDNWIDAVNNLNDIVEQAVKNVQEKYANSLAKAIDDMAKAMTNGLGFDEMEKRWERQKDLASLYVDEVNKAYQLETLQGKINKALSDTTSLRAQEQLRTLMRDQVDLLAKKDKVSQYEIDRANKMYELTLRQIALEEAQANKSKMRLRRDSQGNYRYQYVADESKVDDARQELLDAQNDLYNFDLKALQDNQQKALEVRKQYTEELKAINEDLTLSEEERVRRISELNEWFDAQNVALYEANAEIRKNLQEDAISSLETLKIDTYENLDAMSAYEQEILMSEIVPFWRSGLQEMIDAVDGPEGLRTIYEAALVQIRGALHEYQDDLDQITEASGQDFDTLGTKLDEVYNQTVKVKDESEKLTKAIKEEWDKVKDLYKEIEILRDWYVRLADSINTVKGAIGAKDTNKLRELAEAATKATNNNKDEDNMTVEEVTPKPTTPPPVQPIEVVPESSPTPKKTTSPYSTPSSITSSSSKIYSGYGGEAQSILTAYRNGAKITQDGAKKVLDNYNTDIQNAIRNSNAGSYIFDGISSDDYISKMKRLISLGIIKYDTGGYTGEWGSDGKLAFLHQKELVLNAADTENILSAVDIVRNISSALSGVDSFIQSFVGAAMPRSLPSFDTSVQTLEQDVHIEAHFPNVSNSNEIEEAFNNLVNLASQRAMRNTR